MPMGQNHPPPTNVAARAPAGGGGTPIGTPQRIGGVTSAGTASLDLTTTATAPAGCMIVVFALATSGQSPTGCSDSAGNTYTPLTVAGTGNERVRIFYALNVSQLASGGTITTTFAGSTTCYSIGVSVTGIATASAFDVEDTDASASSTGLTLTSGTLAQANEIVFAASGMTGAPSWTEASGFTTITEQGGANKLRPAYQVVAATSSVSYAPTAGSAVPIAEALATFKGL